MRVFTLALFLGSLFVLAVPVHAQQVPWDLPRRYFSPDTTSVDEALDLVLNYGLTQQAAIEALIYASDEGDASHIPVLKQIVPRYSSDFSFVARTALHALWELGEPKSYFVDLACAWPQDKDIAAEAIEVLARDPDSTLYADLLVLRDAANYKWISEAVNKHQGIFWHQQEYDTLSVKDKFDMTLWAGLLDVYGTKWIDEDGTVHLIRGPGTDLSTNAMWARDRLEELAQEHPGEIAALIDKISEQAYSDLFARYSPKIRPSIVTTFENYVRRIAFPAAE